MEVTVLPLSFLLPRDAHTLVTLLQAVQPASLTQHMHRSRPSSRPPSSVGNAQLTNTLGWTCPSTYLLEGKQNRKHPSGTPDLYGGDSAVAGGVRSRG